MWVYYNHLGLVSLKKIELHMDKASPSYCSTKTWYCSSLRSDVHSWHNHCWVECDASPVATLSAWDRLYHVKHLWKGISPMNKSYVKHDFNQSGISVFALPSFVAFRDVMCANSCSCLLESHGYLVDMPAGIRRKQEKSSYSLDVYVLITVIYFIHRHIT